MGKAERAALERRMLIEFFETIALREYGERVKVELVSTQTPGALGSLAWNPFGGWWRILVWDGQELIQMAWTMFHELAHAIHCDEPKAAGRFLAARRAITGAGVGGAKRAPGPNPAAASREAAADAFAESAMRQWWPSFGVALRKAGVK